MASTTTGLKKAPRSRATTAKTPSAKSKRRRHEPIAAITRWPLEEKHPSGAPWAMIAALTEDEWERLKAQREEVAQGAGRRGKKPRREPIKAVTRGGG